MVVRSIKPALVARRPSIQGRNIGVPHAVAERVDLPEDLVDPGAYSNVRSAPWKDPEEGIAHIRYRFECNENERAFNGRNNR